ncbi:CHASE2 domain-containing protein [Verrucomicrobiota bacterium sgz303538]
MVSGRRPHFRSLLLCCAISIFLFVALCGGSKRYREWEWRTRDQLARFGRKAPPDPRLVFLGIDNASVTLDDLNDAEIEASPALQLMHGGWPFPRSVYPMIIERLVQAGAKVIAFDILFTPPRDEDGAFKQALDRYPDRVIIGANLDNRDQGARGDSERLRLALVPPTETLVLQPASGTGMDSRVGYVNFWSDADDEIVRRALYRTMLSEENGVPLVPGEEPIYSLSARALQKAGLKANIPDSSDPVLFRFAAEVRPYSLHDIFVQHLWEQPPYNNGALFKDKIVLIGPDGNWVKDELRTPFGNTNGPRIHLSALNAALRGEFLRETNQAESFLLIALGGAAAWALGRWVQRPVARFLLLIGIGTAFYAGTQVAFNQTGFFPIVLSPLLTLVTATGSFSVVEWALDRREKARIRRTFERYVSKDVVKEVLDNPQSFLNSLGGERRPVTVLFSDVRGFTTATESADPAQLVSQLNEYFHQMVRIVRVETRGTLDKFIGDAVMAHWGSIVSRGPKADACSSVAAALAMRRELQRLNEDWSRRGLLHFAFGIGINHGEVIVGNIGSEERAEVSVIGDAVNLASRLEGVTKPYHVDICIGETVAELVRDTFVLRALDLIVVKGKTKPVEVFTVLDRRTPGTEEPAWLSIHEQAMRLYRRGEFADAERGWREVLSQNPSDSVAELFVERCIALQKGAPQQPWTGVWEMKTK